MVPLSAKGLKLSSRTGGRPRVSAPHRSRAAPVSSGRASKRRRTHAVRRSRGPGRAGPSTVISRAERSWSRRGGAVGAGPPEGPLRQEGRGRVHRLQLAGEAHGGAGPGRRGAARGQPQGQHGAPQGRRARHPDGAAQQPARSRPGRGQHPLDAAGCPTGSAASRRARRPSAPDRAPGQGERQGQRREAPAERQGRAGQHRHPARGRPTAPARVRPRSRAAPTAPRRPPPGPRPGARSLRR